MTKRINRRPKPGVYPGVAFDVYRSWPYVNNSSLSHAVRSAAHYRHAIDTRRDVDTPSKRFGRLVDAWASGDLSNLVVFDGPEWQAMKNQYARPTSTREWEHRAGKLRTKYGVSDVFTGDEFSAAKAVWQAIVDDPGAFALLDGAQRQVSLVWDDPATKLRCKARIDFLSVMGIVDLKTTYDASQFRGSIQRFGYHRQMAFYRRGLSLVGGGELHRTYLIAAETREPYGCQWAPLSQRALERGEEEVDVALTRIARALEADRWDNYSSPAEWDIPSGDTITVWMEGEERTW